MPIVLTGDVHHAIGSSDQHYSQRSEISLAVMYASIAARYDVKVTLFSTGLAIVESKREAQSLSASNNVEIGGHGWDALRPQWWHRLLSFSTGSPHGPMSLQRRMIRQTCEVVRSYTDHPVLSWRNHAYRHDQCTPYLLYEAGINVWSDLVNLECYDPFLHRSGILALPLNTLPDHEHLYHGSRTRNLVAREAPGTSYSPGVWCDMVCEQVDAIVAAGGTATILAHPICMYVADRFTTFERLCAFLSNYRSLFAREVPDCAP